MHVYKANANKHSHTHVHVNHFKYVNHLTKYMFIKPILIYTVMYMYIILEIK